MISPAIDSTLLRACVLSEHHERLDDTGQAPPRELLDSAHFRVCIASRTAFGSCPVQEDRGDVDDGEHASFIDGEAGTPAWHPRASAAVSGIEMVSVAAERRKDPRHDAP